MKLKIVYTLFVVAGFLLALAVSPGFAFQEEKQEKAGDVVIIPQEVKTVILQGMQVDEPRLDIPFAIIKNLYLPAQQNMHSIFFMKIKNADLGFAPVIPAAEPAEKKEEEEESSFISTPASLQCRLNAFLYFKQLDGPFEKEVYIPFNQQVDGSTYDAEKTEVYTTGYPLPPGRYTLGLALATQNLDKIGTQYYSFTLPDAASYTEELDTTPIFFARDIKRMTAPETRAEIHKGFFTYSVLQVIPNLDNTFNPGDNLDIFLFVFGLEPNPETQRYDIDVSYEVLKDDQVAIRYAPQKYDSPIISQPLPMKQTVLIKETDAEGKTTERREQRDLEPGAYTLTMTIKDNLSGKTLVKSVDFSVVEKEG